MNFCSLFAILERVVLCPTYRHRHRPYYLQLHFTSSLVTWRKSIVMLHATYFRLSLMQNFFQIYIFFALFFARTFFCPFPLIFFFLFFFLFCFFSNFVSPAAFHFPNGVLFPDFSVVVSRSSGCPSAFSDFPIIYMRCWICFMFAVTDCPPLVNNTLISPGYPSYVPGFVDCVYVVPIPRGRSLKVYFQDFRLGHQYDNCP